MKLESEPRQRCAECGAEQAHMVRMERGGPYCQICLLAAADVIEAAEKAEYVKKTSCYLITVC